jgi:hypothetical protein
LVVAKLEPLSEQHVLLKFLYNADDSKKLAGFVQELANAVTDYQVRVACSAVIFTYANHVGFDPTRNVSKDGEHP